MKTLKFLFLFLPIMVVSTFAQTARVQVIHNSADVLAGSVDVYINGSLAINDFGFRAATPFLDLPAGVTLNIGIAPGSSTSVNDTLKNFPVVLAANQKYVVFANGVLTGGYSANPDGRNTSFTLFVKSMARETGTTGSVDLFVLHGATDAPAVDVKAREAGNLVLVNDAAYGDITPYLTVPASDYTLDLYLSDGTTLVASFIAPLSGLSGGSAVVFASGFLNSAGNQNGAAFGLYAALANGTVVALTPGVLPVELSSFTAQVNGNNVTLKWTTATELNNNGFEIQRKSGSNDFVTIAFVKGKGTTTEAQNYSYSDNQLNYGKYTYRLKQIDFNGSYEYSQIINANVYSPDQYVLEQNYPNPFNPSTVIAFSLPEDVSSVRLTVYDALGQSVAELVNGSLSAGRYEFNWNAGNASTGLYMYELKTDKFVSVKKMLMLK